MPDMLCRRASADRGAAPLEVPNMREVLPWGLFVALVQERGQVNVPALPECLVILALSGWSKRCLHANGDTALFNRASC